MSANISTISSNDWSSDVENILDNIRINSKNLSEFHKRNYFYYKSLLKYFKIPIIILTSVTSVVSVGLNAYIEQKSVSLTTCLLSLLSALIGSVEIYLGIQKNMEIELESSKEFLILSYNVFRILKLDRQNRSIDAQTFLNDSYNQYIKLTEQSMLIHHQKMKDLLAPIPDNLIPSFSSSSSSETQTANNDIENNSSESKI
jgi:hypothetical protein